MRKKSKNKWIIINDTYYDYTPVPEDHIYKPWNVVDGLNCTQRRQDLLLKRPKITGHKRTRLMKDIVYKTWIEQHIEPHFITGSYVGLAAAYTPEIFSALFPYIRNSFTNCQIHKKDHKELAEYQPLIYDAYDPKRYGVNFYLYRRDIFAHLQRRPAFKYELFDLDFMWSLNTSKIAATYISLLNSAPDYGKFSIALWHSTNRKHGDNFVEDQRNELRKTLERRFNIHNDTKINYYEGYPMRVDIFTLERKAA